MPSLDDIIGRAVPNVTDWQYLNLNYVAKAHIDQDACIKCGRCHIACEDTSHQAITSMVDGVRHFEVIEDECVGCNLCVNVCPVENCITMEPLAAGAIDQRTGKPVVADLCQLDDAPEQPDGQGGGGVRFASDLAQSPVHWCGAILDRIMIQPLRLVLPLIALPGISPRIVTGRNGLAATPAHFLAVGDWRKPPMTSSLSP